MAMICVEDLSFRAGAFGLEGVSFSVPTGGYAALMGRTGCGKTTILELICGLKRAGRGRVVLMGREVTGLKPAERGIGYVPQDRALFSTMTVREHLAFSLVVRKWERRAIGRRVEELAELLGIGLLLERRPVGLSGGEAQRVALGRALASRPGILLLDEPLSALDDETREEMYGLLQSVRQKTGVTSIHVTHHRAEAKTLADQLLLLSDGRVSVTPLVRLRA
jgi:ABC-type sugar transport system ATPase subunit